MKEPQRPVPPMSVAGKPLRQGGGSGVSHQATTGRNTGHVSGSPPGPSDTDLTIRLRRARVWHAAHSTTITRSLRPRGFGGARRQARINI